MKNLLQETLDVLKENGKTEDDVLWVGDDFIDDNYHVITCKTTWDNFKQIADFEYDDCYGSSHISLGLIIVGNDFWLERQEEEGNEWWEFKEIPKEPEISKTFQRSTIYNRY